MTFKLPSVLRFMHHCFGTNANYNHCLMIKNQPMGSNEGDLNLDCSTLALSPGT